MIFKVIPKNPKLTFVTEWQKSLYKKGLCRALKYLYGPKSLYTGKIIKVAIHYSS